MKLKALIIAATAILSVTLPCEARRVRNGYNVKMLAQYFSGSAFSQLGLNDAGTLATGDYAVMPDGRNGLKSVFVPFRKKPVAPALPELDSNYAVDINNAGVVLGQYPLGSFLYDTKTRAVATIPGLYPVGINNLGSLVLNSINQKDGPHLFKNGELTPLDVAPVDINDHDEVVGQFESDVFIATEDGWDEWLGNGWYPRAINNNRVVVGVTTHNGIFRAVRYQNGELTNIPIADDPQHRGQSRAYDINENGVVAGQFNDRAMVDRGQGFEDLNSLVSLPTGWRLTEAIKINGAGQIVCYGFRPSSLGNNLYRVFLLTPKRR